MRSKSLLLALIGVGGLAQAQETIEDRVDRLETENEELKRRIDLLDEEQERFELGDLVPPVGESEYGLGPAASKIYGIETGISIGGYAEALFQAVAGDSNEADFQRAVLYFGYRFNERWLFNSEYEFEHASTSEDGSVSVEFAYLDYLWREEANFRAGLILPPMGFLNELHEPTTFLSADRPITERRIIPSTWRENGIGAFGDVGPCTYRAYVLNGFDATGYDQRGLRGGRQKGSEALADDLAFVGRVDYVDTPGLLVGGSFYYGDAGQDQTGLGDTTTTIGEVHAEYKAHGFSLRGLYAMAEVDDVAELNAALGLAGDDSVGEEMMGWYVEAGYDLLTVLDPESSASLTPYVRFESVDTQDEVPSGFQSNPGNDFEVLTVGFQVKPIDQIVFKVDYQNFDDGPDDRFSMAMGLVF